MAGWVYLICAVVIFFTLPFPSGGSGSGRIRSWIATAAFAVAIATAVVEWASGPDAILYYSQKDYAVKGGRKTDHCKFIDFKGAKRSCESFPLKERLRMEHRPTD